MKRILLVNPNRYRHPPVVPVGLEYLGHALKERSFDVETLDLCFSEEPLKSLAETIGVFAPDAICITVRNIDSALFQNNEFFLPEIRSSIRHVRGLTGVPVVIGGAGVTADLQGILNFVGADFAVAGPGEETLPELLSDSAFLRERGRVIKGRRPKSSCPSRAVSLPYGPYIERGGIPGFETHKGCSASCAYCIEAGSPVAFMEPSDIVCELRGLAEGGFDHLHLCDSEFNEDLDFCGGVLRAMIRERLPLRWALYMKPGNYNKTLFRLLGESGAYLVTLSADTFHKCPEYWTDIEKMVFLAKRSGIRISIDLLTGFPYESESDLRETVDFFKRIEPDEVVANVFIRLYRNTKIRQVIESDPALKRFLLGASEDGSYLSPVFYNHVPVEKLKELLGGDGIFRIAGEEKVVNYQKATRI